MKSPRSIQRFAAERDVARAAFRIGRVVGGWQPIHLPFRPVLDRDLQRVQHRHAAQRGLVQHVAHRGVELGRLDEVVGLGDADAPDELPDAFRRHAAPAQAGQRRHARIVPAGDMAVFDQPDQPALRKHRVAEIEAGEFVLPGPRRRRQTLDQPVVERSVILELHGADRVGDMLDGVGLAVGEIVGRVDFPARARCADGWRAGCGRARDRAG